MSNVRGFGLNGKSYYTNVAKPQDVVLNFIVDSTNGNGWGVRSVKSNGYVSAVFMKTSATPGLSNGLTNPNPQAGFALVRFRNNFNVYLGGFSGQVVGVTSPATAATVTGNVYVITVLGTTTAAQWTAAGLPAGFTAAVGVTFVATATGAIGGTGKVGIPGVGNTLAVNAVGNANLTLANSNVSVAGAQVVVQFSGATAAGDTTLVATAPADGTTVGMTFKFDASSVTIDGL
jgi:hypothetical protein